MSPRDWSNIIEPIKSFLTSLIGGTADTGGSAVAGTVNAKLNNITDKLTDGSSVAQVTAQTKAFTETEVVSVSKSKTVTITGKGRALFLMMSAWTIQVDGGESVSLDLYSSSGIGTECIYFEESITITQSTYSSAKCIIQT